MRESLTRQSVDEKKEIRVFAARFSMVIAVIAVVAGCSVDDPVLDPDPATLPVVVGSGDSIHSELIAEIYAGALARGGSPVEVQTRLGDRTAYLGALDDGRVTLVPELTGSLLDSLDPAATQSKPDDVRDALSKALPEGLSISDYAGAQRRATFMVAKATDARSLAELPCGEMALGVPGELPASVVEALRADYGCAFREVRTFGRDSMVSALAGGEIGAALLQGGSADPNVVALTDDKYVITAENVIPLFRTGSLTQSQIKRLNVVAGELTTDDLSAMVADVSRGDSSFDVARKWLDLHAL